MARPSKIPENIHGDLLAKAGEGLSCREIAAWLKGQGVAVSYGAVARLLGKLRGERAEITQAVVREKLAPTVVTDVERLEHHAGRLHKLADKLADDAEQGVKVGLYLSAVEQLRRVTETKLHFAGADKPDGPNAELASAAERVRARAAGLRAQLHAGGDGRTAGEDAG